MTPLWPFKKKAPAPEQLLLGGSWSVSEGQHNGRIMIVRTNTAYRKYGALPGYEHQVGIAVPFNEAASSGLPSSDENAQLDEIEEAICRSFEEQAESLLVAVITTSGMREFVFYTREPHRVKMRFEELHHRISSHDIQLLIQSDPKWQTYAQFAH